MDDQYGIARSCIVHEASRLLLLVQAKAHDSDQPVEAMISDVERRVWKEMGGALYDLLELSGKVGDLHLGIG